jgi:hypothetical protein
MDSSRTGGPKHGAVLQAALRYAGLGWSIIPIAAGTKKPPKRFRWKRFQRRRASEEDLREWFDGRDDLGVAVILGEVSGGLVCRDFDDLLAYRRWSRAHRELAGTLPTVATARGWHVYFRVGPSGWVYRDLRPGELGEYRADGGHYCVLPPSPHPDGCEYKWAVPLADGEVPFIEDVVAAELLPQKSFSPDETQKAQETPSGRGGCKGGSESSYGRVRLSVETEMIVQEAVARCIPTGPGSRRAKLFELARRLKFLPEFVGLPATKIDFLKPFLRQWWKKAKRRTSGKHPRFWQSWRDFVFGWEEARVPYGATMRAIREKAESGPPPKVAVEKYGEGSLRTLLAALCRELQRFHGDKAFPLSGRMAAELLGVSPTQAWRWIGQLVQAGIIVPVKKYPRGKRQATEYDYLPEM